MRATDKVLAIIECLAQSPMGVNEISRQLGIGKSTVSKTLSSLKEENWLTQDAENAKYRLAHRMLKIGLSMLSNLNVRTISLPYMNELHEVTKETVTLNLLMDSERVAIEQVQSSHTIRGVITLGERLPIWLGATGKAMMAYLKPDEIKEAKNKLLNSERYTKASGEDVNIDRLLIELEAIRQKGYAVASEEIVLGTASVSAPIFDRNNSVIGALTVIGLLPRFNRKIAAKNGPIVSQFAKKISLEMGSIRDL
jgi:DNA-binding IclR family transcriptional regulator